MAKWKEATERTMSGFMPPIFFIPLMTSQNGQKRITAEITITFLCGRLAGKHRMKYRKFFIYALYVL